MLGPYPLPFSRLREMAYVVVVSAKHKIEHLLLPFNLNIPCQELETKSIHQELVFLEMVLASFNSFKGIKLWVGPFHNQIEDVVHKLEYMIETLVSSYG